MSPPSSRMNTGDSSTANRSTCRSAPAGRTAGTGYASPALNVSSLCTTARTPAPPWRGSRGNPGLGPGRPEPTPAVTVFGHDEHRATPSPPTAKPWTGATTPATAVRRPRSCVGGKQPHREGPAHHQEADHERLLRPILSHSRTPIPSGLATKPTARVANANMVPTSDRSREELGVEGRARRPSREEESCHSTVVPIMLAPRHV